MKKSNFPDSDKNMLVVAGNSLHRDCASTVPLQLSFMAMTHMQVISCLCVSVLMRSFGSLFHVLIYCNKFICT
jgi:hypothetical protein